MRHWVSKHHPHPRFTAAQRRMRHYYAICAALPLFLQQRALCHSHRHQNECAEPEMHLSFSCAANQQADSCVTVYVICLPVCRWCCVSTACSGIPASTCSAMLAQPQRVGVNSSSSGTSTKVTRPPLCFTLLQLIT